MSGYKMFKELNTPLRMFGIRLFRDEDGHFWYKFRNHNRKKLF
ncbi:hypothetical protein [Paenibacillus sp. HB172176]|nr:hypothetical protein [Paenibacillus sp. HB172176]